MLPWLRRSPTPSTNQNKCANHKSKQKIRTDANEAQRISAPLAHHHCRSPGCCACRSQNPLRQPAGIARRHSRSWPSQCFHSSHSDDSVAPIGAGYPWVLHSYHQCGVVIPGGPNEALSRRQLRGGVLGRPCHRRRLSYLQFSGGHWRCPNNHPARQKASFDRRQTQHRQRPRNRRLSRLQELSKHRAKLIHRKRFCPTDVARRLEKLLGFFIHDIAGPENETLGRVRVFGANLFLKLLAVEPWHSPIAHCPFGTG